MSFNGPALFQFVQNLVDILDSKILYLAISIGYQLAIAEFIY